MRKKIAILVAVGAMSANAYAISIDSIIGGLTDKIWGVLDKSTNQVASLCYEPTDISFDSGDVCGLLDKIGNLEMNVCQIAPNIPGFQKKSKDVSLSGLKSLCAANVKEFSDIASTTATNVAENLTTQAGLSDKTKLPNGMNPNDYLKRWDINKILKDTTGTNLASTAFRNGNQNVLRALMDYDASSQGGKKDVSSIKIEDLKAPKDLETYKKQRQELAKSFYSNYKDTSASSISGAVALGINGKKGEQAQQSARDFVNSKKNQFEAAKANEIGQRLKMYQNSTNAQAIPTQESVAILRADLQPAAIAQIRKQQIEEAQIIADVTEKWERKIAIAQLVADKEVIMNEKFDEDAAKAEIDKIVASAGGGSSIGGGITIP